MQPASQQSPSVVRFGVFEADVQVGELRRNGIRVKIQDLPFRALKLLLDHPNEVLSRDQFRHALWPEGVFVDFDHGISSAINRLRDALGDSADNPIFVETVERRGYRWIAPVRLPSPPEPPHLVVVKPESPKEDPPENRNEPRNQARNDIPVVRATSLRSKWAFVLPALALLVAAWGFRPVYRAAKASTKKPAMVSRPPDSAQHAAYAEAQQFYLAGRFYWEKRTPDDLNKAVDSFTQAIVHDPTYAPAYVGLADCYNLMREYTLMPANEAYPRALAAAKKAVELDDQSSEAHASLAFALFWGKWDAAGAEREFRRAIGLNPENPVAHHWYATFLSAGGRHVQALAEIDRAQTLDPASKSIVADKGDLLWLAGHRDEGIALLKHLEATEPNFISSHRYLKMVYFASEDYPSYLEEWKKEATLMGDAASLKVVDAAQKGFTVGGVQGMLQNILMLQKKLYARGLQSPYTLAETHSLLGNKKEALQYLKIAYEKHDDCAVGLGTDSAFSNLRGDPAYTELSTRVGLPPRR
jgi:DNA-binding winged helix-turn-helix (wHTH) protein/tetratricopeptide (TPR) repeat protein